MRAIRLPHNPIVTTASHPSLGDNVNGPSLIRAPDWLPNPLARYYLYFAHHTGSFIRLALADHLDGPWRIHPTGALQLADSRFTNHIASPDAHVDHDARRIVLYFHGQLTPAERPTHGELDDPFYLRQRTRVAESADGIHFTVREPLLAAPYFRAWRMRGRVYALAMPGILYRARDWFGPFEQGPMILQDRASAEAALRAGVGMVRHSAVRFLPRHAPDTPDQLHIFFTRTGDAPERVLLARVTLHDDWAHWHAHEPTDILRPDNTWEGSDCPHTPSKRGAIPHRAWQLRDPAVFTDDDGQTYLLYTVAGEQGIAVARLEETGP